MKKNSHPSISAFFPFLNDWGTIGSLVAAVDAVLTETGGAYEIIIIDDGSDASSQELLAILSERFPRLRIVRHKHNRGYGGALKSGIHESQMDWIFYTDGDAQYDPRELRLLLLHIDAADVINGYKIKRADPWYRIVTGKTYHYIVKLLFNVPIRDTDCDFRLMRRSIFDTVHLESNSGLICAEMIWKISQAGFTFFEVPVHHYWRTSGKSQFFNFKRVFSVVKGLFFLWYKLVVRKPKNAHGTN
jgi:glycosyltransferase involved in cell wall biosynthesis